MINNRFMEFIEVEELNEREYQLDQWIDEIRAELAEIDKENDEDFDNWLIEQDILEWEEAMKEYFNELEGIFNVKV
jgi:hypothetical protein